MISGFPTDFLTVGSVIDNIVINKYNNIATYDIGNCSVSVLAITTIDGINFPTIYKLNIEGVSYILDSTSFGETYTIDITNNYHWTGSAIVFDLTKKQIGWGFLEANHLQDDNLYITNTLNFLGLPQTQENIDIMTNNKLPLSKTWLSFLIVGIILIIVLDIMYQSVKT
jgi:hypothetical protein